MAEEKKHEREILVVILLVLAIVAVYLPVIWLDFLNYDDPDYVVENLHVFSGLKWEGIVWAFTHSHSGNWHPLTWISHMLDCQFYGLKPAGHHVTNLLLHTANTLFLFGLLRFLTGTLWRGACVAALFAVHPLHVESVAWVAERKDVLSAAFGLLALWTYGAYGRAKVQSLSSRSEAGTLSVEPRVSSTVHARRYYVFTFVLLALGLMSKAMLVTWPFVMLLMDYWPLGRFQLGHGTRSRQREQEAPNAIPRTNPRRWDLLWEKLPFLALSAMACVITLITQTPATLAQASLAHRSLNALLAYFRYVLKLIWPTRLSVIYVDEGKLPTALLLIAVLVLVLLTLLVWRGRRARPYLAMGWAWFLGTLVPVIGLVKVGSQSMADRYMYLPAIGLFIMLVWGAAELIRLNFKWRTTAAGMHLDTTTVVDQRIPSPHDKEWGEGKGEGRPKERPSHGNEPLSPLVARRAKGQACLPMVAVSRCSLVAAGAAAMLTVYSLMAQKQLLHWQNSETLSRHALAVTRNNYIAYCNLGFYLASLGELKEGQRFLHKAVTINPNHAPVWNKLGSLRIDEGDYEEAVADCAIALRLDPRLYQAHATLGLALLKQGKTNDALLHYFEALRLQPDYAPAHYNLANTFARLGQFDKARQHYEASLRSDPRSADAHNNLAYIFAREQRLDEAISHFKTALELKPNFWQAHYGLGEALARKSNFDQAASEFAEVIRIKPDLGLAHFQRALALAHQGRLAEALSSAEQARRLALQTGQSDLAQKSQQLQERLQPK